MRIYKDLKLCPFCGGKASLSPSHNSQYYIDKDLKISGGDIRYHVQCNNCLIRTFDYEKSKDAEIAWNRRIKR